MLYRIALGTSQNAPVVEYEAGAASLSVGSEVSIDGVMWAIYRLAPSDRDQETDFLAVLAAPPVVLTLDGELVELYRSELAELRPEIVRLADTREPAAELLAKVEAALEQNEAMSPLSDDGVRVFSEALHALEVEGRLTDRLRAVWNAVRDYLATRHEGS